MIGVALVVQVVTWSMLTFTDVRYVEFRDSTAAATGENAPAVLTPEAIRRQSLRSVGSDADEGESVDPNRQLSAWDAWMRGGCNFGAAAGVMGAVALLPLIGLGVLLAAGAATDGVERTSGAFVWTLVLLMLSLPWSIAFEAVPFNGMFCAYTTVVERVVEYRALADSSSGADMTTLIMFYGKSLALPVAACCGVTAIGLRFRAGVEAGLFPKEDYRLDPEIEEEVSRIKSSSLVGGGGRSAGALHATMRGDSEADRPLTRANQTPPDRPMQPQPSQRPITQLSPGHPPRRPI